MAAWKTFRPGAGRSLLALLATGVLLSGSVAGPSHATDCRDVRTGQSFELSSARFTALGQVTPDPLSLARLCVGSLRATYAVPASDGAGGACVVWIESAGEDCDLRVQHVSASGEPAPGWPEGGRVLCSARGTQTQPTIALAADGGWWLAWKDYREAARSAVYLTRLDAQGEPAGGHPVDGSRVSSATEPASDPALVADGAGGAWLTWQQGRLGERRLLLQHYEAGGALSPGWPAEGRVLVAATQAPILPVATSDPSGGFVLAWVARSGPESSLRLARFDALGAPAAGWPALGYEVAASSARLQSAALATDASGVYLAWSESFEDSGRALLTHLTPEGARHPGWPEGGRLIGSVGSAASSPALALDGAGGTYLAWVEQPGEGAASDVRLVRLAGSGDMAEGWSAEGVRASDSPLDQRRPHLLALSDGVLASWSEGDSRGDGVIMSAAMASLGALPELARIEKWPDLVRLAWRTRGAARYDVVVERRGEDGAWLALKQLERDAQGGFLLDDHEVEPGEALAYRLRLRSPQMELVTGEVALEVPSATPLAIRALAVSNGRLHLRYALPARGESRFELFDVQGRRLLRDVRQNEHAGELASQFALPSGVRAGVFFARLSHGGATRNRRFVLAGR